jgi:hypothetical protein
MKHVLMFSKAQAHRDEPPLAAELQCLREYLRGSKPRALESLEESYRELREHRAQQREWYQQACTDHRAEAECANSKR